MRSLLLILLLVVGPGQPEENRKMLTHLALEQLYALYSREEFNFELTPRWIPNRLLEANPESIKTMQLVGQPGRYITFQVRYLQGGHAEEIQVQFQLKARQKVPVAAQRILNGKTITANMLTEQWVPVTLGRDQLVTSPELLIGNTTRRLVNVGQPFKAHEISSPLLVQAGEHVQLVYKNKGIELALNCEARQSGSKHETIAVYCPETRKKYQAEIKSSGVAEWIKTQ